jgi:hypothetical protein
VLNMKKTMTRVVAVSAGFLTAMTLTVTAQGSVPATSTALQGTTERASMAASDLTSPREAARKRGWLRVKKKGADRSMARATLSLVGKKRERSFLGFGPRTELKPGKYKLNLYPNYANGHRYQVTFNQTRFRIKAGQTVTVKMRVRKTAVTPTTYRAVHVGRSSSCGIKTDATLWCWRAAYGVPGHDNWSIPEPAPLTDTGPWTTVSTGNDHLCGLKADQTAWCWGGNYSGETGNGTRTSNPVEQPNQVAGGGTWSSLGAGHSYTCGLKTDGSAWCWGLNLNGILLGQGQTHSTPTVQTTPLPVVGGHTFTSLAVGPGHTCGVATTGRAWCWGGGEAELGSTAPSSSGPVEVKGAGGWVSLTTGEHHTCGLRNDGSAWCWGADEFGQLGDGPGSPSFFGAQSPIADPGPWAALSANGDTTCGLKVDGTAWCWGANDDGEFGNGTKTNSPVPVPVTGGHSFASISVADTGACAVKADGTGWCWGYNEDNRLGIGREAQYWAPTPMRG